MPDQSDASPADGPVIDLSAFDGAAFDLDGVVTRTATVHASAWKRLFDEFLQTRAARTGEPFRPFDSGADYRQYVDGKPRYEGVRDFLASRGIDLPEGERDDPPERETVRGLGNRKNALFRELVANMGVEVFDGSVALLRTLRQAGVRTAVVSSSENTAAILDVAGLAELFDVRVDGVEAARLGLEGKPAPDTFLHAAQALGVRPDRAFGVEDSLAGVEALRAAGFALVIGVDRSDQQAALVAHGANIVVPDLGVLRVQAGNPDDDPPLTLQPRAGTPAARPLAGLAVAPSADPEWVLVEEGFTLTREHEIESLFAIGNGHIGSRGSLAEGSGLSAPATFVNGVFDRETGAPPGLASLPDWTHLSVAVEGQPLRLVGGGKALEHRRILDLRQAILWREWRHQDAAGRITRIRGFRLASAADPRLLIQSISFTPENYSGIVSVDATIGATLSRQTANGITIALAAKTRLVELTGHTTLPSDLATPQSLKVDLGNVYRLDRIIAVHTSRDEPGDPEAAARAHANRAADAGLTPLVDEHLRVWRERWQACDVRIEGDPDAQRALRFAVYHLLSAANPADEGVSIGARALTGSAYQGHVFWDTEIFMLPFFTLTWPEAAKAMLMYRHHTLPAARRRATRLGFRGAFYAWESADTGDDVTPPVVVQPDGEVVRIFTGEQEQHISADVAYAVWSYWHTTGDEDFLLDAGAEILLETARFWADRAVRGDDGRHHIHDVIGPDEYHETVDDNAYTNGMAKWNLGAAAEAATLIAQRSPQRWEALSSAIALDAEEPAQWKAIAGNLYTGLDETTGLIEQFRGYFDLEDIDLSAFEHRNAPMDVLLGSERIRRSQVIKQADVLMLLHLLWDDFSPEVREANFRYYEPRCGHGSSLSPAIHALLAVRLGDMPLALRYFQQAMEIDLSDNMGNAAGGIHAGALGGLWQAVVFGFAGLHLTDHGPEYHSHLPPHWNRLSMQFGWQGQPHHLEVPATVPPPTGRRTDE